MLFCDAAEVDVGDLNGFQASPSPALAERVAAAPVAHDARGGGSNGTTGASSKAAERLRRTLGEEIAALLASERATHLPPVGKWLTAELVLAADRLAGGVTRRGADLLGVPETTIGDSWVPRTGGRAPRPLRVGARSRARSRT